MDGSAAPATTAATAPPARGAYRHPYPRVYGRLLARVLNARMIARVRLALLSRLPFPVLRSDVADVVYVTWMVDARAAAALLPAGLRLWTHKGKTPLTVLTYRHGHFGPALAGPVRRLFPSPLQSNWRLYLDGPLPPGAPRRRSGSWKTSSTTGPMSPRRACSATSCRRTGPRIFRTGRLAMVTRPGSNPAPAARHRSRAR